MLYISQLLVILHKIPLARKALLENSGSIIKQYGFNEDWWRGYIIDLTDEFALRSESLQSFAHMTVETQRLMAFLDGGSRRPLACIDNLAVSPPLQSTLALKGDVSDINPVGRFLEDLVNFWGENAPVTDIFESTAVNVEYHEMRTFTNIVTEVSHSAANSGTLYDVVDELLWPYNSRPESYLAKVSDVITLTLKREDAQSGAGIDVPLLFFPDRYTQPYIKYFSTLRERQKNNETQLSVLINKRFQAASYMGKDTSKLLKITSDYLDSLTKSKETGSDREENGGSDDPSYDEFDYTGLEAAAEDMKSVMAQYTARYDGLVRDREEIQSRIDREANLFKGDSVTDEEIFRELFHGEQCPKLRTFILSGVILSPTEYYFCRRKEKQLINLDEDEGKSSKSSADSAGLESAFAVDKTARKIYEDFQWYKVSKTFTDEGIEVPSAVEIANPHEVTAGAKTGSVDFGSQEAILVYATLENAWDIDAHGGYELSPELKEFIERDRRSLLATLRGQEAATAAVAAAASTPSAGSTLQENIATPDSLLSGTTAGSGAIQGGQRFAPQSDSKLGEVNIRANPTVTSNNPPCSATVVSGAASTISVKELPDTASHGDDDDDEYSSSGDSYSRAGEEVTTGLVNGADAMELDFAGLKKN
jgi:hypothetical protein